jgi:hypothetical protein
VWGREHVSGHEILQHAYRSECDDRHFDSLSSERIARQLLLELFEPGIELSNRLPCHGARRIEKEHARATWLRVIDEREVGERNLSKLRHGANLVC